MGGLCVRTGLLLVCTEASVKHYEMARLSLRKEEKSTLGATDEPIQKSSDETGQARGLEKLSCMGNRDTAGLCTDSAGPIRLIPPDSLQSGGVR